MKVLILVHNGFEEIEALVPVDLCRRAGIEVCLCSMTGNPVLHGAHHIDIAADARFEDIQPDDYDMVVLPGGMPNATSLRDDDRVMAVLQTYATAGKWIGAICAAPIALERAGLLAGKAATSYPGCLADEQACNYQTAPVVVDGHLVTSRGPGTAIPFALKIIRVLTDAETAETIEKGIILHTS